MTQTQIYETESKYNVTILYLATSGSKLYGTNTPTSDTDFKGIFIPSQSSRLLGTDPDYIKLDSNTSNQANTSDDIDCHLYSIHAFFNLISKGETNAIDTLFSMWTDHVLYSDTHFVNFCKARYLDFITSKPHAYLGYAVSQCKRYNIRGQRYTELVDFISKLPACDYKLSDVTLPLSSYSFIKLIQAPGPRGSSGDWTYLEVLGKKYTLTITVNHLIQQLTLLEQSYGNRVKTNAAEVDWKALSHAYRVSDEIIELLTTTKIQFPLRQAPYIKEIKQGLHPLEDVINSLEQNLAKLDSIESTLNPESNQLVINTFILSLYRS